MHHKKTTGSPKRTIKGIGKTGIESEIFTRIWVHLIWSNVIKSFRRLVIPLPSLWPEVSRKFADWICIEQRKLPGPILLPDLQCTCLLIDADKDRCITVHIEAFHLPKSRGSYGASPNRSLRRIDGTRTTAETRHDDCNKAGFYKSGPDLTQTQFLTHTLGLSTSTTQSSPLPLRSAQLRCSRG